jgi:5'-3' exonuclease
MSRARLSIAVCKSDEGVPPELRSQFDAVEEAVRSIGGVVWSMHEHEADDGLASGARRFRDQVEQVRILTPDKDLGQCLQGDRVVQVDRRQKKVVSETAFRAERGFGPRSVPDFLALVGDSADGIPGLTGFGKKSASLLVGAYERLERIPAHPSQWKVKPRGALRLAATLVEQRDDARRSPLPQARDAGRHRSHRGIARGPEVPRRAAHALHELV